MPMSDVIQVNISSASAKVAAAGFGILLLMSPNAAWVERSRTYADIDGVAADWAPTTPEYIALSKALSQDIRPERVMVGRCALKPTQTYTISVRVVANLTTYRVKVGANTATFTSDASALNDEIVAGLVTQINLLTGDTTTATATGAGGSQVVTMTGNAAGNFDNVEAVDLALLQVTQTHADPGSVTDLTAIKNETNAFYAVANMFNSKAVVDAIAAWAETNKKAFFYSTNDGATVNTPLSGTDDVAESTRSNNYDYTVGIYHPSTGAFAHMAWLGKCLPLDPGSETWKFKSLTGVPTYTASVTELTNAASKNLNVYESLTSVTAITTEGVAAGGEYFDVVRFCDWLAARIGEDVLAAQINNPKIGYTDDGVAILEAIVRRWMEEGERVGGLRKGTYTVIAGKVADQLVADRTVRVYKGLKFNAQLAGAIHKTVINGNVTV